MSALVLIGVEGGDLLWDISLDGLG
jgi:hypothetical protein